MVPGLIVMDILIGAMLEAESLDPVQRAQRASYRSGGGGPLQPVVVMGLSAPGHKLAPIVVEDDRPREELTQEEEDLMMMAMSIPKPGHKSKPIYPDN